MAGGGDSPHLAKDAHLLSADDWERGCRGRSAIDTRMGGTYNGNRHRCAVSRHTHREELHMVPLVSVKIPKPAMAAATLAVVLLFSSHALPAWSALPDEKPKPRLTVSDFRPEKGTTLSDRELDYCKMLQRAVEGELVEYYEVEESTKYGEIARATSTLDTEQAARVLGEKAGVNEVVTGLVTKVGQSAVVQLHFVEVPRSENPTDQAKLRILRTVNASHNVEREDNWIQFMDLLVAKVKSSMTGQAVKVPDETRPPDKKRMAEDERKLAKAKVLRMLDDAVAASGGPSKPKLQEALNLIDQVTGEASDDGEAWYIRGAILFFMDRLDDAEKSYTKAVQLGYDRASVREDLANTFWRMAYLRPKQAKAYYGYALEQANEALRLAPNDPWAYNIIGCVTFSTAGKDKAKLRRAADALKRASELLTSDPALMDNTANALLAIGELADLQEAERYARWALDVVQKNGEPYPKANKTLERIQEALRKSGKK